jgi:hypothetical protein
LWAARADRRWWKVDHQYRLPRLEQAAAPHRKRIFAGGQHGHHGVDVAGGVRRDFGCAAPRARRRGLPARGRSP